MLIAILVSSVINSSFGLGMTSLFSLGTNWSYLGRNGHSWDKLTFDVGRNDWWPVLGEDPSGPGLFSIATETNFS